MNVLAESEELHERVRRFARESLRDTAQGAGAQTSESFEALAQAIYGFQRKSGALRAQRVDVSSLAVPGPVALPLHGAHPDSARPDAQYERLGAPFEAPSHAAALLDAPQPVSVDAFRHRPLFAFDPAQAEQCFVTSGTTAQQTGRHYFRTTETYRELAALWGGRALLRAADPGPTRVLALLPEPSNPPRSSLGFMVADFMRRFEVAAPAESERWLLAADGVNLTGLRQQVEAARRAGQSVHLMATSFALVMLCDQLAGQTLPLPPGSVVLQTGGFKGRTREVGEAELREQLLATFGDVAVVGEYGMTELTDQLYEATLPGSALAATHHSAGPGVYHAPPWLRVVPLEPTTLQPVPRGEVGLASFIDLGNVDSCLWVLTQDWVRAEGAGIRLLGRRPRAPLRGCSLAAEALYDAQLSVAVSNAPSLRAAVSRPEATPALPASAQAVSKEAAVSAAMARVERLRALAQRIAAPADPLGQAAREQLPVVTGLSREAVELGLSECLETRLDEETRRAFCAAAPPAPRVWVVLSANVFVAAFRAIAWGLAASEHVFVKASQRDPVLARLLAQNAPGLFDLVDTLQPRAGDHVHAYGSDETLATLRAQLPAEVRLWGYGSGLGVGLVLSPGKEVAAAVGFARDTVLFEQRGCLSPRVIGVRSDCDVDRFVGALQAALAEWGERVAPATWTQDGLADQVGFMNLAPQIGEVWPVRTATGTWAGAVFQQELAGPIVVPPPGRLLTVFTHDEPVQVLQELTELVTCVGVAASRERMTQVQQHFPGARLCAPGVMQRPPFDGPVDRRGRQWT